MIVIVVGAGDHGGIIVGAATSGRNLVSSVDKTCTDYSWSTLDGLWMDYRWTIDGRL